MLYKLQKSCFRMLGGFLLPLYKLSIKILMVLSRGKLIESTSRLVMYKLGSCWIISSAKWNEYTVYSLAVEGVKNCSKKIANL